MIAKIKKIFQKRGEVHCFNHFSQRDLKSFKGVVVENKTSFDKISAKIFFPKLRPKILIRCLTRQPSL